MNKIYRASIYDDKILEMELVAIEKTMVVRNIESGSESKVVRETSVEFYSYDKAEVLRWKARDIQKQIHLYQERLENIEKQIAREEWNEWGKQDANEG